MVDENTLNSSCALACVFFLYQLKYKTYVRFAVRGETCQ
jgi:hypothetical protein